MLRGLPRLQCNLFCVWLELRTRLPQYTVRSERHWFKKHAGGGEGQGFKVVHLYLEENIVFTHPHAHSTFRHGTHDDAVGWGGGGMTHACPRVQGVAKATPRGGP